MKHSSLLVRIVSDKENSSVTLAPGLFIECPLPDITYSELKYVHLTQDKWGKGGLVMEDDNRAVAG